MLPISQNCLISSKNVNTIFVSIKYIFQKFLIHCPNVLNYSFFRIQRHKIKATSFFSNNSASTVPSSSSSLSVTTVPSSSSSLSIETASTKNSSISEPSAKALSSSSDGVQYYRAIYCFFQLIIIF